MPALALSASTRAIAGSLAPNSSKSRSFLPDSSSPTVPVDITSPDTATTKRSLLPGYLNPAPKSSRKNDASSEESLPTPPPTSSVRDAEDDGIEELSESDFTAEELSRSARRGRVGNMPSSSTRSPTKRRSPAKSKSPIRQATLSQLFNSPKKATPAISRATKPSPVAEKTPVAKSRSLVEDSDDDDVPLVRTRSARKGKAPAVESDDDVPLSVTRGKGKQKAINDPPTSSSVHDDGVVNLCSSDPMDPSEDYPMPGAPDPVAEDDYPMPDADPGVEDDYDDVPFPFDYLPDEADYLTPAPPPPLVSEPSRKRPRASVFDLPDFALEPASQVERSSSPAAAAGGKLPAVKFSDFSLLSELDEKVRTFYEQHWRRGAGDEDNEWHEHEQLSFTTKPPPKKRAPAKGPAKRGGWFWARGRGRGRGRR